MHRREAPPPSVFSFIAVVVCALACPGRASALEELEIELGLYNRLIVERARVERLLRFDPQAGAFDLDAYLNPARHSADYAVLAAAGIYVAPTKWLGFGLSVDSGEVRPRGRIPAITQVQMQRLGGVLGISTAPVLSVQDERRVTANGQPIGDEARDTFFIRQAFVRLAAPATEWLTLTAGRRSIDVGGGLIYNDFGLGVRLAADLERLRDWPLRSSIQLVLPTRTWQSGLRSPLLEARASYVISLMEDVGIVFAYFHDGDSTFEQALSPLIAEVAVWAEGKVDQQLHSEVFSLATQVPFASSANLYWAGLSGNKLLGDFNLSLTALVQFGKIELQNPFATIADAAHQLGIALPGAQRLRRSTLGLAVDLGLSYPITDSLTLGGWFLFLSGDDNPLLSDRGDDTISSFLSIVPYLTHTNIFFAGGMNETFSGRRGTTAGLNGRGVVAPGVQASWEITDAATVASTAAALFAPTASQTGGGHFYGVEADFEARYEILDWMAVSLEYDFLVPGGFFARDTVIHKFLIGLDLSYSYTH